VTNIILCGGNGTRLWPISRTLMPKQFVKLFDDESLFQLTIKRNINFCDKQIIVSNAEQYFLAKDQIEELDIKDIQSSFLLEPVGRNTAPAIALACFSLDSDEVVLVSSSDHMIKNQTNYENVLSQAQEFATSGYLVTFGITPTYPEIGYGYIEADGSDVKAFHEKPDLKTAQKYLSMGNFFWNSGIFCFKAGVFLEELQRYSPDIYEASKRAYESAKKDDIIRIEYDDMQNIPEDSIDYAVMEKTSKVKVVSADIDWSDLGSFDALDAEFAKDENGNTLNDKLIAVNSQNNFIYAKDRVVALVNIDDLIVVDTPDALLISKKGDSQKIKDIVKELKVRDSDLPHTHLTVHRPWGRYTILEDKKGYKIKKIIVHPSKRLSLQKHFHRSEHWVVVSGIALVTIGKEESLVKENESIYIPIGEEHRLENPGKVDVVLIEAQVGDYLGEDDIVRIEDDFERL